MTEPKMPEHLDDEQEPEHPDKDKVEVKDGAAMVDRPDEPQIDDE